MYKHVGFTLVDGDACCMGIKKNLLLPCETLQEAAGGVACLSRSLSLSLSLPLSLSRSRFVREGLPIQLLKD